MPGAVKFCLWKAGNNLLATKANLYKKKVVEDNLCPICCGEEKIVLHVLWQCPTARDVDRLNKANIEMDKLREEFS